MSSDEHGDVPTSSKSFKKRRIHRACDMCRRKKIRCDGVQMSTNRCTNCVIPPKAYIDGLETRVEKLIELINRISPEALKSLDDMPDILAFSTGHPGLKASNPSNPQPPSNESLPLSHPWGPTDVHPAPPRRVAGDSPTPASSSSSSSAMGASPPRTDHDSEALSLTERLNKISLETYSGGRYFGKSSAAGLIRTAMALKREYMDLCAQDGCLHAYSDKTGTTDVPESLSPCPRTEPLAPLDPPQYVFPDADLMPTLIDLYFTHINVFTPLLHRPTFERELGKGLHRRDAMFAVVVLLVCAVGSRYSEDPRVLLDDDDYDGVADGAREGQSDETSHGGADRDGGRRWHSAGWKWFVQVPVVRQRTLSVPSLYDLQFFALLALYLQGTSAPHASWTVIGVGIRFAQDVGAHRKKSRPLTVEDELWNRAFWVLICMDRVFSASLGRPCAIQEQDFDVDPPTECDDEYWDHPDPEQRWKQPPNKPSVITYFNHYIKLTQILAFLLRTIYAINKSEIAVGFTIPEWEQTIISKLDSSLNTWIDSLPHHLRWDPHRLDTLHLNQSASLYSSYYLVQILIHRPFIQKPRKLASLSFSSLAKCTNAARACSHVVDVQRRRGEGSHPTAVQWATFSAGIVLLLSIWGGSRSGLSMDSSKGMEDVQKCMDALKATESRFYISGRLWDIMSELASVRDIALPRSWPSTRKREREVDDRPAQPRPPLASRLSVSESHGERPGAVLIDRCHKSRSHARLSPPRSRLPSQPSPLLFQPLHPSRHQQQTSHKQSSQQDYCAAGSLDARPTWGCSGYIGEREAHAQDQRQRHPTVPHVETHYWYGLHDDGCRQTVPQPPDLSIPQDAHPPFLKRRPTSWTAVGDSMESVLSHPMHRYNPYDHYPPLQPTPPDAAPPPIGYGSLDAGSLGPSSVHHRPTEDVPRLGVGVVGDQEMQEQTFDETYAMWSDAPVGFELDKWGSYLSNISGVVH